MRRLAVMVLVLILAAIVVGCSGKGKEPTGSSLAKREATLEHLQADLKELKSLHAELEDAFRTVKDGDSWGQFSARWNRRRQTVFDRIDATYAPSEDEKDVNYQGCKLLGAGASLLILWEEYSNLLSGKPADPLGFKAEFQQYISEVDGYLSK